MVVVLNKATINLDLLVLETPISIALTATLGLQLLLPALPLAHLSTQHQLN
jgi:hypothetical protein